MLPLGLFLLPLVLATVKEHSINNYVVEIEDNTLKKVEATNQSAEDLNLSSLEIRDIDKIAFRRSSNVKALNLANNLLSNIPEFLFQNLTNLEHLNLAGNKISELGNVFVGLKNLKSLNISNNPLDRLDSGWLLGLNNFTDVFVGNNSLRFISTGILKNPYPKIEMPREPSFKDLHKDIFKYNPVIHGPVPTSAGQSVNQMEIDSRPLNTTNRVKVCIQTGKVKSLELFQKDEVLASHCSEVVVDYGLKKLILRGLEISGFEKGWYRLQNFSINAINLDENAIVRVTSEILNDLPAGLGDVTVRSNKIERLEKGVMKNEYLRELDLSNNFIREIEDGALENMNATDRLHLNGNRLRDTKFAFTLPKNITELNLCDNEIGEISVGSFSKLGKLVSLKLDGNNITAIQRQTFRNLRSLRYLKLANNGLMKIHPGAFEGVTFLRLLDLKNNSMSSLEKDLFSGLDILLTLNIGGNNFSKITRETMSGLPYTVHHLVLDNNGIENLSGDSFVQAPILSLSLDGNNISKIDEGSFNLPNLRDLSLKNNSLSQIYGNSFEGLKSLRSISLAGNGITNIQKGVAKNLGNLSTLDLSNNPIEKLENGALYGLQTSGPRFVHIMNTHIELIQGGLFDDV